MNRRQGLTRLLAIFMIAVFASFYCGNTMFMHRHTLDGKTFVHSHPLIPGQHHSHSAQTVQTISLLNAAAQTMAGTDCWHVTVTSVSGQRLPVVAKVAVLKFSALSGFPVRAPPARA